MSLPSPYPSPPYSQPEHMDFAATKSLYASTWHVIDQPPPPTLREILTAYKNKGDGDRDMLLAMLNAKTAEDQRIAAIATLHQRLLDARTSSRPSTHDHTSPFAHAPAPYHPPSSAYTQTAPLPRISPTASPKDVTLPSIQTSTNPRKRPRTSQSPPPIKRRASGSQPVASSEQLPPSPPSSSPGRSAMSSAELHPQARAMAIGSLLSSSSSTSNQADAEAEWPSRTSAERTGSAAAEREREGSYRRQSKLSA